MQLNCVWCGSSFEAVRSSRKFCSDRCKTANHRYDPKSQIEFHLEQALYHISQIERVLSKDKDVHLEGYSGLDVIARVAEMHIPGARAWWWDHSTGKKVQGRLPGDAHRHDLELWQCLH